MTSAALLSGGSSVRRKRRAEGLKQRAVHCVALRIVLRVPLNTQRKAGRISNPDSFDRSIFCYTFDDNPVAGLQNALTVQRVHTDNLFSKNAREGTACNEPNIVALGEDDGGVWMDLSILQSRHAMVHAAGQIADLRMQ